MSDSIAAALIGLAGSGLGAFGGIMINAKMMSYRLEQLEKRFEKVTETQSAIDGRLAALEKHNEVQDERQHNFDRRLGDLEKRVTP